MLMKLKRNSMKTSYTQMQIHELALCVNEWQREDSVNNTQIQT